MSTQCTALPSSAKPAAVTRPTYPAPTTAIGARSAICCSKARWLRAAARCARRCSREARSGLDRQKRLAAADLTPRARLLLAALRRALKRRPGLGEPALQLISIERLGRDRLLDQQQRAVVLELDVALGLREAHDLLLRAVQTQLGRLEQPQQRLMPREDADGADSCARRDHLDLLGEGLAFGRHDLDGEARVGHRRP